MFALLAISLAAAPDAPPAGRSDALARYGAGLLKAKQGLPVQAVAQLEAAAKADPTSPEPLKPLVKLYADLGRDAAAERAARKALDLDPADADTAQRLGLLLFEGRQFAEAAAALKQAADSPRVAVNPSRRLGLLRDLARANEAARDPAAAEAALRAAVHILADRQEQLLANGRFESKAEFFREQATVHELLGRALEGQKKYAEAAAAFADAGAAFADKDRANDPLAAARTDWNLSGVLLAKGDPAAALTRLDRFLALGPAGAAPYERLADVLRKLGRGDEVAAALDRLAAANPKNPAVRWVRAAELVRDDADAGDKLFRELAGTTTDAAFFALWVRALTAAKRADGLLAAADHLFGTSRPDPHNPVPADAPPVGPAADRAQAFAAAVKAEPGAAAVLLRQAVADGPAARRHHPFTWELAAGLAERDGNLPAAEAMYRSAAAAAHAALAAAAARFRNDPKKLEPFEDECRAMDSSVLEVLAKQRKWRDVKREAQAMIARPALGGRSLTPDVFLATACAELGDAGGALAALQPLEGVKADGMLWALLQKPRVLNMLGRHRQAADECRKLLTDYPKPADARRIRTTLSDALLGLKDPDAAEAELRAVLEDDPDDVLALNNLGYNLADQGRKLPEAEEMIRRAMALDRAERLRAGNPEAESGIYLDSLGWVLFRRGKLAEARAALERAVALPDSATDATVWDHLGDVCFRLADKDAAKRAWEKAFELYADSHAGRQGGRRDEVARKLKQVP